MDELKMDVSNLCRSCLKEVAIKDNNFNQDTVKMFTFCTNIQIRSEDQQLPMKFCNQCTDTIQSCYTFVYTAREVDHRLREMFGMVKPENADDSYNFDSHNIKIEEGKSIDTQGLAVQIKIEPVLPPSDLNSECDDKKRRKHSKFKSKACNSKSTDIVTGQMDLSSVDDEFKTYICTACSKGFVRKKNYENHMLSFHNIENVPGISKDTEAISPLPDHRCSHCPETFNTSKELQHHKKLAHTPQRYDCPHCSLTFDKRLKYTAHLKTHIPTLGPPALMCYTCDYCKKMFRFKSELSHHLAVHDSTLKSILCDICGSRFGFKRALRDHRRVHTGEKPFTCEECGYTCSQKSNMARHVRAHKGERKHQCMQCGKAFNEATGLKKHMIWHTGERPYKCPHCDRRYACSGKRKIHMIRHHGIDPAEIPRLNKEGGPARRYVTSDARPKPDYTVLAQRPKKTQTETVE